jgi:hypothetical protein
VIKPATPTGSIITVVLSQWRVHAISSRAFSGHAAVFLDHGGRQIVDARGSRRVQPVQDLRAFFLRGPAECRECVLGRRDRAPRVFFISERDAGDHLAVGRLDDIHDFAAVGFNKSSVDVVRGDCLERVTSCGCFHGGHLSLCLAVRTT